MKRRILIASTAAAAAALAPSFARAGDGAEGAGGSWLSLSLFAVNFSIFAGALVYFLAPLVRRHFGERAGAVRGNFGRLESALREAENYRARAAARLEKLEEELRSLAEEIEAETAFQVRRIRDSARESAERLRRDAEMTAGARADEARRQVRGRLAAAAVARARALVARRFGPGDQRRLIDDFMERLRGEAAQ